jgi:hypothetical protein
MNIHKYTMISLFSVFSFAVLAGGVLAQPPQDVLSAAQDFLNFSIERSKHDPDWFEKKWEIPVDRPEDLRMGKPYECYVIDKSEMSMIADGREMFTAANLRAYGIPVFADRRLVGTIRIGRRSGDWGFEGLNFAPNTIDLRLLKLRDKY